MTHSVRTPLFRRDETESEVCPAFQFMAIMQAERFHRSGRLRRARPAFFTDRDVRRSRRELGGVEFEERRNIHSADMRFAQQQRVEPVRRPYLIRASQEMGGQCRAVHPASSLGAAPRDGLAGGRGLSGSDESVGSSRLQDASKIGIDKVNGPR